MADNPSRIGQINGPFATLFKLSLVTYPVALAAIIAFSTWLVMQVHAFDMFRVQVISTEFSQADWSNAKKDLDRTTYEVDHRMQMQSERILRLEDSINSISVNIDLALTTSKNNNEILKHIQEKVSPNEPR